MKETRTLSSLSLGMVSDLPFMHLPPSMDHEIIERMDQVYFTSVSPEPSKVPGVYYALSK